MHIAIVGGGLSAYLLAYRLKGAGYAIEIFEDASNLGGNCHTCSIDVPTIAGSAPTIPRWADMAVNDFNAPMYRDVVDTMDALGVTYAPLEDTASFYSNDTPQISYTLDGGWGTRAPQNFEHLYAVFAARAWDVMNSPSYANTTVAQFLANEPPFAAVPEFATRCVLPRVNAMYFCDPAGPGSMPIQTAYLYYYFQEGFGTDSYASPNAPPPQVNRQYFIGGAHTFVDALRADAQKTAGVVVRRGQAVTVVPGDQPMVFQGGTAYGPFDRIVMACRADQAIKAFPTSYDTQILAMLKLVQYADSTAYVHVDDSLLPSPELRRTYNVLIRSANDPNPQYSMTYVINEHQADRENTIQPYFDCAQYYVSLNPIRPPASDKILVDKNFGTQAIYGFPHNVGNFNLRQAQTTVWDPKENIQGRYNVWFIGGWTTGAGLMIECWNAVSSLLALWNGQEAHGAFDATRAPEHYAPAYVRRAGPPRPRIRSL